VVWSFSRVARIDSYSPEALQDLGVVPAERLEQNGHALLALAVDADAPTRVPLVDLELEPTRRGTG